MFRVLGERLKNELIAVRALSDYPADSRQGLVNIRFVRANPETEAKPIAAVIAMHIDASKLCLDFARARRPERKEISVLCIGAKRSDQVGEAQSLDVNSLDPFEEARHQGLRMEVDVLGGDAAGVARMDAQEDAANPADEPSAVAGSSLPCLRRISPSERPSTYSMLK